MKTMTWTWLVVKAAGWAAAWWLACQVSAECRTIRAELAAEGREIDPLEQIEKQLDALAS